jgi:hypothetical protein
VSARAPTETGASPAATTATRSPAEAERRRSVLTEVPRPAADSSVARLSDVTAGGLDAVHAEWGPEGGAVVLSARRPFLDVTGRAGFRADGSLDGTVQMHAKLTMLGLSLGDATWTVAGWAPSQLLMMPNVQQQGTTLRVDLTGLPAETDFVGTATVPAVRDDTTVTVELPGDVSPEGEPLSPRYAEIFRGLLGVDVSGVNVHPDAPVAGAPAFVSGEDLFFAPGVYGVDSPDALQMLDAALRASLAGLFGTVGAAPPPPQAPPPEGEPAAVAETSIVNATVPDALAAPVAVPAGETVEEPAAGGGSEAGGEGTGPSGDADAAMEEGAAAAGTAEEAPPPVEVIMPEAPTEPTPAAAARGGAVAGGAGGAAAAARDMPTADESTGDARGAVTEPASETAARAREAVVAEFGEAPPPSPEIVALTERIRTAIRENRPEDEDALLETDPTHEAQAAGATITGSVETQSTEVAGAYDAMASPPSGSPALTPVGVTPPNPSSPGMGVDAASAAPDPIPPENTSLDADVAATDQRIADSGMETRVTAEIPDGPFQAQRDARGELGELAQRTPEEIHAEEQVAIDAAQADMANLQLQAVAAMQAARARTAGDTTAASGNMTGSEELTRDNVSQRAQGIYDQAQRDVTALLTPLSRTAMARWDAELARHSREFHQALDAVQRWIDERHSGVIGTIVAIGDYIAGLPGWVIREYNRAEQQFGDGVCETLLSISSDVNAVIASAQAIIRQARDDINGLFDQMEAEFPEFVAAERARFSGMLDGLSTQVTNAQTSFVRDVSARAITAVNEAHAAVQAKRDEAGGLIGRVVAAIEEFIDDPVRAIINGLLRLVGIPPGAFWSVVAQIEQAISDIADNPENFINNLTAGVKQGFQQFFDNFGTHLLGAFWRWLFSGLRTPIPMPTSFDPMALVTFALQLMGITWPNVREILVRHLGPEAVELLEIAWQILSTLITQGPQGLVNMIKDMLSPENIVGMILDAAIEYIIEKLIVKAAEYVFSLLNPAGAVAQAIMLIYRVCSWIFRNAARIFAFVQAVVGGIANVIAGNIGGLAAVVERALASMLVVVIDLFMGLLGLGDLPAEVADVITRMQAYVLGIIDRIVGFLVTQARALLRRMGIGGEDDEEEDDGNENDDDELGTTVRFSGGRESHRLWIDRTGDTAVAMVASTSGPVTAKIDEWRGMLNPAGDPRAGLIASIDTAVAALNNDAQALAAAFNEAVQSPTDDKEPPDDSAVESGERSLSSLLREGFDAFGQANERELLQAIAAAITANVPTFVAGADATLATFLVDSKHVPQGTSQAADVWPDKTAAAAAADAGVQGVAADSSTQRPLLAYFESPPKQPEAAAEPAFWTWAVSHGGDRSVGSRARKAYGDAYVAGLKSAPITAQDPVDEPLTRALSTMRWRAVGAGAGEIAGAPALPTRTDPPLRTAAGGDLIQFLRDIASGSAPGGYSVHRLRWAWNEHEPSHAYLERKFRNANGGRQHEWIPTNMFIEVVDRAVLATGFAPSGARLGVQWINLFNNLRTDTSRVYFKVLNTPVFSADTTVGTQQVAEAGVGIHSGGAYNQPTGPSTAGTIGQEAFHDALRSAFRQLSLSNTPHEYIQSLLWVVADVIWDGDLAAAGVPSPVWGAPLQLWFRVPAGARQGGLTLIDLSNRQRANIDAIDADFNAARSSLG